MYSSSGTVDYWRFSGGATEQATVRIGDATNNVVLRLPANQRRYTAANTLSHTDFAGTAGNTRTITIAVGGTGAAAFAFASGSYIHISLPTGASLNTLQTLWESWAGDGSVVGTGNGATTVVAVTTALTFTGGRSDIPSDVVATALVVSGENGRAADAGLTLTLPTNEQRLEGQSGNGWQVRITQGSASVVTSLDFSGKIINLEVSATTLQQVQDAWTGTWPDNVPSGTAALTGTGTALADSIQADSLYSPTPGMQAHAAVNGIGSGRVVLTLPETSSWHHDLVGTAGNGLRVSLFFWQPALQATGEAFRISYRRYTNSNEHIFIMFANSPTLNDLVTAWTSAALPDPDPSASGGSAAGVGRGGIGGTAALEPGSNVGGNLIAASQNNISFADGRNFVEDSNPVLFAGGTGFMLGVSKYIFMSNALTIWLKGNDADELSDFWTGTIGGTASLTGDGETELVDFGPVNFTGGVDQVVARAGREAAPRREAVMSSRGNGVPDSTLNLRTRGRNSEVKDIRLEVVERIRKAVAPTIQNETKASVLVEDDDNPVTTGGARLSLPSVFNTDGGRVTFTGSGTYDGMGTNGDQYSLSFSWVEPNSLGGYTAVVNTDSHTITISLEKHEDADNPGDRTRDTNPTVGDLVNAWLAMGGSYTLVSNTGADAALADASAYSSLSFSGGTDASIDLGEAPDADTISVRETDRTREVLYYSKVDTANELTTGRTYRLEGTQTLEFHGAHNGRQVVVEYGLPKTACEFGYVGNGHFLLVCGSDATWDDVKTALNADHYFSLLFDPIELGSDLKAVSEHGSATVANDKPSSGTYRLNGGNTSLPQRAVVTSKEDAYLVVGDVPIVRKFVATTGSSQDETLGHEAHPGTVKLSHSNSAAPAFGDPVATVGAAGQWKVSGTTLTYWTDHAGTITISYAYGLSTDDAVPLEIEGEALEVHVPEGKSLYARKQDGTGDAVEGSVTAYDISTEYPWVYGFDGVPREQ